jgi:hypothetical protein
VKSANVSILAGIVLMTLGVLWLLDRLGVVESGAFIPPLIFTAAAVLFLALFMRSRENWWAAIPGSVFLGLAAVTTVTQFVDGGLGAAFLFLFMGAGFAAVYWRERGNWWALIPAGVMLTLAVVVALPQGMDGMAVAAVLMLGFAATFGLLSLVPVRLTDHTGRMMWPLIPAAVLAVLGVIFALQSMALLIPMDLAVPAVMILAGVALMVYAYFARQGRQRKLHGPSAG